jgi:hypothetical protein
MITLLHLPWVLIFFEKFILHLLGLSLKKDIVTLKLLVCFIRTLINKWLFCRQLPTLEGTCYLYPILKMEAAQCWYLFLILQGIMSQKSIGLYNVLLQEREECPFAAG